MSKAHEIWFSECWVDAVFLQLAKAATTVILKLDKVVINQTTGWINDEALAVKLVRNPQETAVSAVAKQRFTGSINRIICPAL